MNLQNVLDEDAEPVSVDSSDNFCPGGTSSFSTLGTSESPQQEALSRASATTVTNDLQMKASLIPSATYTKAQDASQASILMPPLSKSLLDAYRKTQKSREILSKRN